MSSQTSSLTYQENKSHREHPWIVLVYISMYLFGALFYTDPFHFWHYAPNEKGATKTLLGRSNMPFALRVMMCVFLTGRTLLEAARVYRGNSHYLKRHLHIHQ